MIAHEGSSLGTPKQQRPVWERVLIEDVSVTMEKRCSFNIQYEHSHLIATLNNVQEEDVPWWVGGL
jgi:hypothetical protein